MTDTLSVEGLHERVADAAPIALVTRPDGVDGAVVSGHAVVVTVVVAVVDTLPAPSTAATPTVYVVAHVRPPRR